MRLTLLLIVFTLIFCSPNYAAIYKWTNKQEVTSFTQQRPKNKSISFEKLNVRPIPFIGNADEGNSRTEDNTQKTDELSIKQAKEVVPQKQTKADREELKRRCAIAKQSLVNLSRGGNRLYKDANGEHLRLDEESKNQKRREISQFLADNCQ